MKRKSLLTFLIIGLLLAQAVAASFGIQTTPKPAGMPVEIPFELVNRHIVLQIKVNNSRPLSFVFDTGDKVGIIDLDRAKELGLKLGREVKVGGAGGGQLTGALVE